ncbi:class I SAM-dependent methyltransferase [Nocardia nova]|uniref:class I SAM-dependent methyltransferase n=1 Tax=Nocardia nova TaxID=37330 RepID=UPI000CEA445B|nr:class I SAM-dependent methyltransferase [Nocardia nova]PPI97125.1 SAM-dependent methyltransferase [Nocardia nova]
MSDTRTGAVPEQTAVPDQTAVRVALWRALHVRLDPPPHVLDDEIGLRLADPPEGWRERGDMHPVGTSRFRASVVVRSRFVEDLLTEQAGRVGQYVLLGAGLETFPQRKPDIAARFRIFEVDQPQTQAWKRQRLAETGYGLPEWLRSVPVDFEKDSWWERLTAAGFDPSRPAIVASLGVSMYLTDEANRETLSLLARTAPGSTVVMTFQPPLELLDEQDRPSREFAVSGAAASGTPFLSFYAPAQLVAMAREAGFAQAHHISADELNARYFAGRPDGLRTSNGEELLVATT